MFKKEIWASIWAIFFISLGGWLLHLRYHPVSDEAFNWIPAIFGGISTLALPFMFSFRKTVVWAFLINWAAVLAGTITMGYESVEMAEKAIENNVIEAVTVKWVVFDSLLKDILILWAKIPLGAQILNYFRRAAKASSEIA